MLGPDWSVLVFGVADLLDIGRGRGRHLDGRCVGFSRVRIVLQVLGLGSLLRLRVGTKLLDGRGSGGGFFRRGGKRSLLGDRSIRGSRRVWMEDGLGVEDRMGLSRAKYIY